VPHVLKALLLPSTPGAGDPCSVETHTANVPPTVAGKTSASHIFAATGPKLDPCRFQQDRSANHQDLVTAFHLAWGYR
jgi:hypothetical protein